RGGTRARGARRRRRARSSDGQPLVREQARNAVGFDELVDIACRCAAHAAEDVADDLGDVEEREPSVEEGGDGNLVRGVERAWKCPALLPRLARERKHREGREVGRAELERERSQVERLERRRRTL